VSSPLRSRPDRSGPWGTTLVLSLILHLAGFGIALGLPHLMPRVRPGAPVYVVDLVALPAGPPAASPAPPEAGPPAKSAARKAAPPKPEKPVKIPERDTRKQPTKKAPEPKKPEPPKPDARSKAAPAPAVPPKETPKETSTGSAPSTTPAGGAPGTAGGQASGAGGTGAAADAYSFYTTLLKRNIEYAWRKPRYPEDQTGHGAPTVLIRVTLTSSGRALNVEVVTPSGYEAMDRSVLGAVQDAQPFPPFPSLLGSETRTFSFEFVLEHAAQETD
jgi:periplasmic protein TonB